MAAGCQMLNLVFLRIYVARGRASFLVPQFIRNKIAFIYLSVDVFTVDIIFGSGFCIANETEFAFAVIEFDNAFFHLGVGMRL